ncbi:MMPL family transporter [Algiphilus aromaticivorans]|uniref:MMPL family transporter n=1 Tax=Algiphilus aromaticivorans TaxID=382454 RepID=UPI001E480601|nr:MMPL family transporter [Algiphilus aromaticivorans]
MLALALGFGVLMSSSVPPLQDFGLLVAVAVVTSFAASLTALPALIALIGPQRLFPTTSSKDDPMPAKPQQQGGFVRLRPLVVLVAIAVARRRYKPRTLCPTARSSCPPSTHATRASPRSHASTFC